MDISRKNEEGYVRIQADDVTLEGSLALPEGATGVVLFAHGSGSSRFSPRNRYVASVLQKEHFATLLMDLLTKDEERIDMVTVEYRFNIEMLSNRLLHATRWLRENAETKNLAIGYFGASIGAAAAIIAAAKNPNDVQAIVSRGGRPDLAINYITKVKAATLLIVGGNDVPVIKMNERALKYLQTVKKLEIVPGASHLFEEPGALEEVAKLALAWFNKYLTETISNEKTVS
jgi:putative phosphoribosyl transferase